MLQIQGEVARAKARTRVYEDYNQMEVNSEVDEVESNVFEEKVQQRWRYKDQRQENLRANVEDNTLDVKVVPEDKKSKSLAEGRSKAIGSDAVEYGHIPDKNQPDMVAMMSKLLRQKAALLTLTFSLVILLTTTILLQYLMRWLRKRLMILGKDWQD